MIPVPQAKFLIEISYEVANFNGGVYTVLATKAKEMQKYYNGAYYTIGPYYQRNAETEFEEEPLPAQFTGMAAELKKKKILCHYGTWLVPGRPKTFLVDFTKRLHNLDAVKQRLQKTYGVDCAPYTAPLEHTDTSELDVNQQDLNLQLVWGDSVRHFAKELLKHPAFAGKPGIVHFHFSDPSAPLAADLRRENAPVGIVATAHSTRLGRAIMMHGEDLWGELQQAGNGATIARKKREYVYGDRNVPLHHLELLLAENVDTFTAVSSILSRETAYVLGRTPDLLTPNGLNIPHAIPAKESSFIHNIVKNKLYRFLNAYFSPYYPIDLDAPFLFFTAGRYELRTKGYELLFEALGRLNRMLKQKDNQSTIYMFLFIMTPKKKVNEDVLAKLAVYDAIEHEIEKDFPQLKSRLIARLLYSGEKPYPPMFDEDFLTNSKKLIRRFIQHREKTPPVCAFNGLQNDDKLLQSLHRAGLLNRQEDKIKIVFYPAPVSVTDGLLSLDYHSVISSMHLGIFPSLYEPWGYTPHETAAHGVLSITTDVSGFGRFVLSNSSGKETAVQVLRTLSRERKAIVDDLAWIMHCAVTMPAAERVKKKLEAQQTAALTDWSEMAKQYIEAHNEAIGKAKERAAAGTKWKQTTSSPKKRIGS